MKNVRRFIPLLIALVATPAFGDEGLPRVLILGDRVYQQPTGEVAKVLKGKAEVVYATVQPGEVRSTTNALVSFDRLLGEQQWDLIHFNFGLGDLIYRAPGMKSFRVFPKTAGGVRATSPPQYEKNLQELVKRLKATGAKLIWANTTPIRHSSTNVFEMGSEIEYNRIAQRVMARENITINDMYTFVKNVIDMKRPAGHGADPFFFDRKPLHAPIVAAIRKELTLPAAR